MPRPSATVILVPGFPADERDTDCVPAVQNYVAAYAARHPGRAVHVVAFQYPFGRGRYRWKDVTVHALAGRNRSGLRRLSTWGRALWCVLDVARRSRVEVLHSFWLGECAWVGQGLGRMLGVRHVASIAGQDACAENPYLRWLRLSGPMVVTAGSAFAAHVFEAHAGRGVDAVIPLGLDAAACAPPAPDAVRDVDLLGVGALTELKQFDRFVRLADRLRAARPGLQAWLLGDGPERAALERAVAAAGLAGQVHLKGHVSREDVLRIMRRSRILLHPSRYEGQGYVFLEALAAGLHVVSFDVGHAVASPKVHRCRTEADMEEVLRRLLAQDLTFDPVPVPTAEETAAAFERMFQVSGSST